MVWFEDSDDAVEHVNRAIQEAVWRRISITKQFSIAQIYYLLDVKILIAQKSRLKRIK